MAEWFGHLIQNWPSWLIAIGVVIVITAWLMSEAGWLYLYRKNDTEGWDKPRTRQKATDKANKNGGATSVKSTKE